MTEVKIRRGLVSEAVTLTEIARIAKRHWGYPEEWMLLWKEALTLTESYVSAHHVFVAEVGNDIVGFYALAQTDTTSWELDHLWIRPTFMRRGFGRLLFNHAVDQLESVAPGAALDIESDPNAESFYVQMGATRVGEITRDWPGLRRTTPHLRLTVGDAEAHEEPVQHR